MLVTLSEILADAEKRKYGVGLFNMLNLEMARGIIEAAEEEKSPLILGVAEVHLPLIPFEYARLVMTHIAANAKVPVCLHFDHGTDFDKIKAAIDGGFSSVMYDGSALPYEENIKNTRIISDYAKLKGVSVEAELGHVGGGEGGVEDGIEEAYTKVEQVNDFIDRAGIDALAVAIGTAHGPYKKKPKLDIGRLAEIYKTSKAPLVLHGGSGLSEDQFRATIDNGIRKVNICTEMCIALREAYIGSQNHESLFREGKDAVKEVVKAKMRLFDSSNKA